MNITRLRYGLSLAVLASCAGVAIGAQERGAGTSRPDPRVGLKAGIRDAGQAIRNMTLVASMPKPSGFFDPASPVGSPTAPEPPPPAPNAPAPAAAPVPPAFNPAAANRLAFATPRSPWTGTTCS